MTTKRDFGVIMRWAILYAALITLAVIFITPFIYMVSLSFQTTRQAMTFPPYIVPDPISLDGYEKLFVTSRTPILLYARNSLLVAGLSTIGSVASCALAGYAFARIRFRGSGLIFSLILATTFVPAEARLVPLYIMYSQMGWIDTFLPLIAPHFFGHAVGIFLLRQFFANLPQDLEDAARVDGAHEFQIFYKIFLPLAKPALATWAVLVFMESWNDLLGPLIFTTSRDLRTLTLATAFMSNFYDQTEWFVARMGMSLITIIPLIVLYISAQKYFVQGIARTGIK